MTRPIPVIFGPTAVGKTDISLAFAELRQAEIIGADSRQIYRLLDIGTAKPSPTQRQRVPHHLIDLFNPDIPLNAAHFARLAWGCIHAIEVRALQPLIVGGSGLYIRALTDGLFVGPGADPQLRATLEIEARCHGEQALHARLAAVDPEAARRIHPHDRVRLIRALEIHTLTGEPISRWQSQWRDPTSRAAFLLIGLTREREDLRQRIAGRTESMLQAGLVEEVRRLLAMGYPPTLPTLQSVGYGEIIAYLDGRWDLQQARVMIERHTWHLAKRQMTWFRRLAGVQWVSLTGRSEGEALRIMRDLYAGATRGRPAIGSPEAHGIEADPCTCPTPK
jgi:tRNA dimethylallyltransferase